MKITKGKWESQEDSFKGLKGLSVTSCDLSAPLIIAFLWADGCEEIQIQQKENAALIADAGTVANDTGFTPSQLLEQRDDLLVLCKATVYCNSSKAGGCKNCPLYGRCGKEHGLIATCKAAIKATE